MEENLDSVKAWVWKLPLTLEWVMLYNFYFPLISTQREIRGGKIRETAMENAMVVQETRAIPVMNAY